MAIANRLGAAIRVALIATLMAGGCPSTGVSAQEAASLQRAAVSPSVRISPDYGPPGTRVRVQVSGYPSDAAVSLGLGPLGGEVELSFDSRTGAGGTLTTLLAIPDYASVGQHWVVIAQSAASEPAEARSNVFVVTDRPLRTPIVSVWPAFGPPGATVHVEGRGFRPASVYSVGFGESGSRSRGLWRARADAQGRLSIDVRLPLVALPGEAWVAAVRPFASSAQPAVASATFKVTDPAAEVMVYIVKQGDTLLGIASSLGTTLASILEANREVSNPSLIYVGQRLRVPEAELPLSAPMLPDLQLLPPSSLYVENGPSGAREVRFSTTIANTGDGPLVLRGEHDPDTDLTRVSQYVETREGAAVERFAGYFVYHPAHAHWHFEDLVTFEIWTYRSGGLLNSVVATAGKMSFCLVDTARTPSPPPNAAATPDFRDCDQSLQGISVGWEDIYDPLMPGQQLDISALPDGRYAIRAAVNPDGYIEEVDSTNNSIIRYVEIEGDSIAVLPGP